MQKEITTTPTTTPLSVSFTGTISEVYEEVLGGFLFEPFATDILQRIKKSGPTTILELACGTGRVTKKLAETLASSVNITATDLQADMLNVAKHKIKDATISWDIVDMTNIPYEDNRFDMIVCQFGLMLVPDKLKALAEMYRALKPGGKLLFNVWGNLTENTIWKIGGEVLDTFLGINPITQDPGPFSMNSKDTVVWLNDTGFTNATATLVKQTGTIEDAAIAAKGFINGLPVIMAIQKKVPAQLSQIEKTLELELIKQLGNHPMQSPLSAWVFEATK